MKLPKLKESAKNILGITMFYCLIIIGVIAINTRFEYLNSQTKSADEGSVQTAQNLNR